MAMGVLDQTKIEKRQDVLVYTGEALSQDTEVTGPISLSLYAASSAPDTDFTAKLIDLRPDGYAQNIAEGVIRAASASRTPHRPDYTGRGVRLYHRPVGHQPRVQGRPPLPARSLIEQLPPLRPQPEHRPCLWADSALQTAQQTIFHDSRYPSHLVLPVIPR